MDEMFSAVDRGSAYVIIDRIPARNNDVLLQSYKDAVENADQGDHFMGALLPYYEMEILRRMDGRR